MIKETPNENTSSNLDANSFLKKLCVKNKNLLLRRIIMFGLSHDYFYASYYKDCLIKNKDFNEQCPLRDNENKLLKKYYHYYKERKYIECKTTNDLSRYGCERHQERKRLRDYIIFSNWFNVSAAAIFFFLIIVFHWIIALFFNEYMWYESAIYFLKQIIFIFILIRVISRAIEVSVAFYNDVVKVKMNSDLSFGDRATTLKRGNRISLAVHSYIEFVLLFAILYYSKSDWINSSLVSITKNPLGCLDYVLYSAAVSAFNFSFDNTIYTLGKFVHVLQVFLSIILVVLSLATYLGLRDEMNEYEKVDWEEEREK
ncbi:TPA: hypothetical protein ROY23_002973 [Bacillus wiedmannii]|uniref:hypothetical protein n=1 Tax=Bacillus wiedmannii TaxID=1890302 RepID=UPI000BF95EB5|nr:hypothetical protein [Bacillus wiedmannii]PEP54019.1 hypothetical protein CN557_08100 [Bacillus wiedmannii]HDX9652507.1 hypothetical protein [Bacillus wiedmannii]